MTTDDFPSLRQFLGCYLHQDWREEHPEPQLAVRAFLHAEPEESRLAAVQELDELIGRVDDLENPGEFLLQLGCYYDPGADCRSVSEWLNEVRSLLNAGHGGTVM